MDIAALRRNWEALGRSQPMRAILERRDPWDVEELLATGRERVDAILAEPGIARRLHTGRALDFGCGIGRLTQALAERFDEVVGVDIAASMIELANRHNRFPRSCTYILNTDRRLSALDDSSFDFALSLIVLQHVGRDLAVGYIAELLRVLRPGGLAFFQAPSERIAPAVIAPEVMRGARLALLDAGSGDRGAADGSETLDRASWRSGSEHKLRVLVHNASEHAWTPEQRLIIGTRWQAAPAGAFVDGFDSRLLLPGDVPPGDALELSVEVFVPRTPGLFTLSVGVLQDGVAWFVDHGAAEIRLDVDISAEPSPADASNASDVAAVVGAEAAGPVGAKEPLSEEGSAQAGEPAPRMEMHPVPEADVVAVVERAGGEVLEIADAMMAGAGWRDLSYLVARR